MAIIVIADYFKISLKKGNNLILKSISLAVLRNSTKHQADFREKGSPRNPKLGEEL
jgi:hypothetical protein